MVRCFENDNIVHVNGKIDPISDKEIIDYELIIKDLDTVDKRIDKISKQAVTGDKEKKIFFCNHQGFIETLVLYEKFIPTATILKDVLLSWPIIGWALRLLSS